MSQLIQNVHKTQEYFLWALSKDVLEEKGVIAFAPGITSPNLNFALQTGDFKDDRDAIINIVENFFKTRGLSWSWMMNPLRDQDELKAGLESRGFSLLPPYPVMVYEFGISILSDALKNFDIREVSSGDLSDWILPLKEGFKATEVDALLYREAHQRALQKKAGFRHFIAYVAGVPVSAATLSLSSYGARLDDIGTKPSFQRKGFATSVILYAMKVAQELGYPWVCLEASDEGMPLYTKLGFKELYRNEIYSKKS